MPHSTSIMCVCLCTLLLLCACFFFSNIYIFLDCFVCLDFLCNGFLCVYLKNRTPRCKYHSASVDVFYIHWMIFVLIVLIIPAARTFHVHFVRVKYGFCGRCSNRVYYNNRNKKRKEKNTNIRNCYYVFVREYMKLKFKLHEFSSSSVRWVHFESFCTL